MDETPKQKIIRLANELTQAILDAGYSINQTESVSGFEVSFYQFFPRKIQIWNILSDWKLDGDSTVSPTFKESYENEVGESDG